MSSSLVTQLWALGHTLNSRVNIAKYEEDENNKNTQFQTDIAKFSWSKINIDLQSYKSQQPEFQNHYEITMKIILFL